MKIIGVLFVLFAGMMPAEAQYYSRYAYSYPGRGYYSGGGYHEHYAQHYLVPPGHGGGMLPTRHPSYAPRGGYDWSWGGGNRGYLGGRGGGWGGEW